MTSFPAIQPRQAGGALFSVLIVLVAVWIVYKGVELTWFDRLHGTIASAVSVNNAKQPLQAELAALQASADAWRDTDGVRFLARADYQALAKALYQSPNAFIANAIEILQVDPVNADRWMDIAEASWSDPNARAVSFAAWQTSSIVAPRELNALQRRIVFLLAVWPEASEAQRRRMFFEVDSLLGKSNLMRRQWRLMMSSLSEERRREVEDAFRTYNPAYRR